MAAAGMGSPSFAMDEDSRALMLAHGQAVAKVALSTTDRAERGLLLTEAGEVEERVLGDELAAAKHYLGAVNSSPRFRPPLDGLIRLYVKRKSASNLLKLSEALVRTASTERAKAEALCLKAEVLEDRMNDEAGARATYEEASVVEPTYHRSWIALERMGRRSGDLELAQRALAQLAALTVDPSRKSALLCELARDLEADEGTREQAADVLRQACELPSGQWRSLIAFERFAERYGRLSDLAWALELRASIAAAGIDRDATAESSGESGEYSLKQLAHGDSARRVAADLWSRAARVRALTDDGAELALADIDHAMQLAPDDVRYWLDAMSVADRAGHAGRAAEAAQWLLDHDAVDPSMRGALMFRLAEAAAADGDGDRATSLLRGIIATGNGEDAAATAALFDQLLAAGDAAGAVAEYDRLAQIESGRSPKLQASLQRAAATLSLAMLGDRDGAMARFALAADADDKDLLSRRAWLTLLPARPEEPQLRRALATVDALLAANPEPDERARLLFEKLLFQRVGLKQSAANTAELLARAGEPWALSLAMAWHASEGAFGHAARIAQELLAVAAPADRADVAACTARLLLAGGDEVRAREVATSAHLEDPADAFAATLAFRLALAARESGAALDILVTRSLQLGDAEAAAWLTMGAVLLGAQMATAESRKALEAASERDPASPAVRAALLATTRWRADFVVRGRMANAGLSNPDTGDEETALGVQYVLAQKFLEHDAVAAEESMEMVTLRAGHDSLSVALLHALMTGSRHGPDAQETVNALQMVLGAMSGSDPLRNAFELEVARALSSSVDTADQARDMRQLLEEESDGSVAPRLLALLDAIQREDRSDLSVALNRVAESADPGSAVALRSAGLASLLSLGNVRLAREFALRSADSVASVLALSELPATLDQAGTRAVALKARAELAASPDQKLMQLRRAALWSSLAGRPDEAIALADLVLAEDPADLAAWDIVRTCSRRQGAFRRVVDACKAMAKLAKGPDAAAALWEEAGVTLFDQLERHRESEQPLRTSLDLDPTREMAYRRLRIILEARKDFANLENLVTTRLSAEESEQERVALLWEQARLRRALGRREEALESAMQVVELEPEHVAALALVAEVNATSGRLEEAAEALVALSSAGETPVSQRRVARQGAIDIFEHRLKKPNRAIELLERMVSDGEANDATIERGLGLSIGSGQWDAALRFSRVAVDRAPGAAAKCKALLRVCEIQRDRVRDSAGALSAARMAHDLLPSELSALRAVHGLSDDDERSRRARKTIEALREMMRTEAPSGESARRIALAAELGSDQVLTRVALRAARALGEDLPYLPMSVPSGKSSLKEASLALRIRDPNDAGARASLVDTVMPDLAELAGVSTDGYGLSRGDRVRGASPIRDVIQPYATLAGMGEFELYVGGNDDQRIAVIPGSTPSVVFGKRVVPPLDDTAKFRLMRALLLAVRGLSAMDALGVAGSVECLLAAMVAADLPLTGGNAAIESRLRPVARALSRRSRKATAELARPIASSANPAAEVTRGVCAAFSTVRRAAIAATGALPAAFADLTLHEPSDAVRRELVLFAVSDGLSSVVREIGVERGAGGN
ncbi:MAG: hypothetical protein Q8Q09_16290 [Deltaproteobacteria bacterium]|nr:hypothetical protein [Deltaproteobacteria bacterium]